MNQREWEAWDHIVSRVLEGVTDYNDYPGLQELLYEDLLIIQDLLPKEE